MTDSTTSGQFKQADNRLTLDRTVAIVCFGFACAVGLVFSFVGLETHSFTYDELFTLRLLQPLEGTTLLSRIATDVHPPLYLLSLSLFTDIFGDSDASLRAFSAVAACGAIVVFIAATRRTFSLPARLFAAAMATGSLFWFHQAQNARSYAFGLLISVGVMALGLSLLQAHRRRGLAGLLALMVVGSFVHFYVMYVSLAVLIVLWLFKPRDRIALTGAGLVLFLATGLYVKFVMEPLSQVSLQNYWLQSNLNWYLAALKSSVQYSFGDKGLVAILLCSIAILYARFSSANRRTLIPDRRGVREWLHSKPEAIFLGGVPVIVFAGAVVSSTLLSPNFWDRNFLLVSPFIWGLVALAYDTAAMNAVPLIRLGFTSSLAIIVLSMTLLVSSRLPSGEERAIYEPFRQSARWIQSLPACRGQVLPVVTTDDPAWYKPGYAEFIYESAYGRYLLGFAQPRLIFGKDLDRDKLPRALKQEMEQRVSGGKCPILVWTVHNMTPAVIAMVTDKLLRALDVPKETARISTKSFHDGALGYVLYVE